MANETLKSCPFCGGEATFEHLENTRWSVGCADIDGACMGFQSIQTFARKADAIAAWSQRASAPPADSAGLAARLAEFLHGTEGNMTMMRSATAPLISCAAHHITALEAEIARLREALEPFAKAADIRLCGGDYWTAEKPIQGTDIAFHVTFGDLRRAALAKQETGHG